MVADLLKSRRVGKVLAKLIPLFSTSEEIKITYNSLAKELGYTNRSGAYKAIQQLINYGILERNSTTGAVRLKLKGIIID